MASFGWAPVIYGVVPTAIEAPPDSAISFEIEVHLAMTDRTLALNERIEDLATIQRANIDPLNRRGINDWRWPSGSPRHISHLDRLGLKHLGSIRSVFVEKVTALHPALLSGSLRFFPRWSPARVRDESLDLRPREEFLPADHGNFESASLHEDVHCGRRHATFARSLRLSDQVVGEFHARFPLS